MHAIDFYTDNLWKYYENLYDDTGLGSAEILIKEQYKESYQILHDNIYTWIERILWWQEILGYSQNNNQKTYTVTSSIGTRRLFIEYREYSEEKIRVVMDVQIIRK